jgi:hypothetical protein
MHLRFPARFIFVPVLALASFFAAGPLAGLGTTDALAITNCNVADVTIDSEERAFLNLINSYRAQNGAGALTISVNLNRAASWMAVDLGAKNYFSHTDSLGRDPSRRVQDCGFPGGAGENIAAGTVTDTAQEAFDLWRNSPGHNSNMLNASYRQIGIARAYAAGSTYGWYWVTDFSLVSDGTDALGGTSSPPPPAPSTKATMISPANGATLNTTQTFQWTAASGGLEYFLYIGTSPGANNWFGQSMGTNTSITLAGFPRDGRTVYVRLWTRNSSGWQYNDFTYRDPL